MEQISQGALQVEIAPQALRTEEALQAGEIPQIEKALIEQGLAYNLQPHTACININMDSTTDDRNADPNDTNNNSNL